MTTQGTEARSAETTGSARKGDGSVAAGDAPDHPTARDWQNRAERAEAECKELRAENAKLRTALNACKQWEREIDAAAVRLAAAINAI